MSLLELQRRMTEDVCRPLTEDFNMQSHDTGGLPLEEIAARYIKPNKHLSSFERLEVYNRQYWLRVIAAVSEDFPTVEAIIGNKRFAALVTAYLQHTPSRSWNLCDLSGSFPDFLRENPSLAGRRHRLAVDAAALEWAYINAFDGRQAAELGMEALNSIGPDSRLCLQPHLQLLALDYPVDDVVLSIRNIRQESEVVSSASMLRSQQAFAQIPAIRRAPIYLAVHRFDDSIYYRRLDKRAFFLLSAIRAGKPLEQSVTEAFQASNVGMKKQAELIQSCFSLATQLGWITETP